MECRCVGVDMLHQGPDQTLRFLEDLPVGVGDLKAEPTEVASSLIEGKVKAALDLGGDATLQADHTVTREFQEKCIVDGLTGNPFILHHLSLESILKVQVAALRGEPFSSSQREKELRTSERVLENSALGFLNLLQAFFKFPLREVCVEQGSCPDGVSEGEIGLTHREFCLGSDLTAIEAQPERSVHSLVAEELMHLRTLNSSLSVRLLERDEDGEAAGIGLFELVLSSP